MSKFWYAAMVMTGLACATPATAQRVWQNGRWVVMPQPGTPTVMRTGPQRWHMQNGRWDAGYRAPGGWNNYRRLDRGASLPGFWMASDFRIPDYLSFGLAAPPQGYFWVRYYDDAVLVDRGGRVWDSVGGIGWSGGAAASVAGSYSHSESYSNAGVGAGAGYPPPRPIEPVDPNAYYGAPPQDYDAPIPYPQQYPGGYAPSVAVQPPAVHYAPAQCVPGCPGGAYQGGAFYGGNAYQGSAGYASGSYGYGYAGGAVTTIIITPAPIVTTTTTTVTEEVIEDSAVETYYESAPSKRVLRSAPVRKMRARARPRTTRCVCR